MFSRSLHLAALPAFLFCISSCNDPHMDFVGNQAHPSDVSYKSEEPINKKILAHFERYYQVGDLVAYQ